MFMLQIVCFVCGVKKVKKMFLLISKIEVCHQLLAKLAYSPSVAESFTYSCLQLNMGIYINVFITIIYWTCKRKLFNI